jgi:hypothetical protein
VRCHSRVPEYDAFGREIGDDPLAALRASVNPAPARPEPAEPSQPEVVEPPEFEAVAPPEPEVVGPPVAAPPPRPQFVRPQRRRRRGGVAGLLVLGAIVAAVGLVGNAAVEKGNDIIQRVTPDEAAPVPATGVRGASLIRADNFAAAVETLSAAKLGRPLAIRVAPDRIDATLVKGGTLHQVQITPDGELRELGSGGAAGSRPTLAYAAIDTAAPERLTRAGATRKQPARSIDYVLLTPGPPVTWGAYYKRGRIVIGDRHGRLQRVI